MSKFLSSVAVTEFDSLVHQLFQADSRIPLEALQSRSGVVGEIYKFRTMGKGLANQKASQADVTPMDVTHSLVPCTLENWISPEYTDIFDQTEVNFDEKNELAKAISSALHRRRDQLVIDALDTSTPTDTISTDVGTTGSGLNTAKLRATMALMDDNGVPEDGRYIVATTKSKATLLSETETTSSDYNTVKALVRGEIDSFLGFKFLWIPANAEGGITVASSIYDNFAFHRNAVGIAIGMDIATEINYIAEKTSWLCTGKMRAGATAIDGTGVVKIQCTES